MMEQPLKSPVLMRLMASLLVEDVSELCRRMASLNRHAIRFETNRRDGEDADSDDTIRDVKTDG